jgi:hypothetical protein
VGTCASRATTQWLSSRFPTQSILSAAPVRIQVPEPANAQLTHWATHGVRASV